MRLTTHRLFALGLAATALIACGDDTGAGVDEANQLPYAEGSPEAKAILWVANDRTVDAPTLQSNTEIDPRAAENVVKYRETTDANHQYDELKELFAVKYCKKTCLDKMLAYAKKTGHFGGNEDISVIFSPQPTTSTHLARVAEWIDEADETIDIAMYSYSHADPVRGALERAINRGVKVRFLADTDLAIDANKSGGLENMGIDVRRVTKIMHHKFAIIDGPRDDAKLDRASTAHIISGSGNWSTSAGTIYDENTLFMTAYPELALRLQRDFDTLWAGSKDQVYKTFQWDKTRANITDALIAQHEDADSHAFFTSGNFKATSSGGWTVLGTTVVTDALVAGISEATKSVKIASGHFLNEPIANALIERLENVDGMNVDIILDCQEATKSGEIGELKDRIEELGGRILYKCNTFRWHYVFAKQMHHKYIVIDEKELYTGSLNFSMNAETNTFENMLQFQGDKHAALVAAYVANHAAVRDSGRDAEMTELAALREEIESGDKVPLKWDLPISMSLDDFRSLKDLIRAECPATDSSINDGPVKTYNKWFNEQPQWFASCSKTGYPWPAVPTDKRL